MSLIKPTTNEKEKIKIVINAEILKEVRGYCNWAKTNENDFFEQAAKFIFSKDKEWKNRNKKAKTSA